MPWSHSPLDIDPERAREASAGHLVWPVLGGLMVVFAGVLAATALYVCDFDELAVRTAKCLPIVYLPTLWLLASRWRRYRKEPEVAVLKRFGMGDIHSVTYWLVSLTLVPWALNMALAAIALVINAEAGAQEQVRYSATVVKPVFARRETRLLLRSDNGAAMDLPVPRSVANDARPGDQLVANLRRGSLDILYYRRFDGRLIHAVSGE